MRTHVHQHDGCEFCARREADRIDAPWKGMGVNVMTPKVLERGISGTWAWELSEGVGFTDDPIFGTTFRLWDDEAKTWTSPPDHDDSYLDMMFHDEDLAREHVRSVLAS